MGFTDFNGDFQENEFWVKNSVPWTGASILAMLDAFTTWFQTGDGTQSYMNNMSNSVSLVSEAGRDNTTQHGLSVISNAGLPVAGTVAHPAIQAGCTKSLTARTGLAGKSYRGRTFLIGIDETEVPVPEAGVISATYMTHIND